MRGKKFLTIYTLDAEMKTCTPHHFTFKQVCKALLYNEDD